MPPSLPFSWSKMLSTLIVWMLVWMALGVCFVAHAQPQAPSAPEQYVAQWSDEAVYQMAVHGIPASITLAQGILESGSGQSQLAAKSLRPLPLSRMPCARVMLAGMPWTAIW